MTREQITKILTDAGVEAGKLLVNALMNEFNADKGLAVEEATKTATEQAKAEFKDYVSKEEHDKLLNEITTLKDAGAKAERLAKYKELGLLDKYAELADSKLKESKDLEKDLEAFKKDNEELFKVEKQEVKKEENVTRNVQAGDSSTHTPHVETPKNLGEALEAHYSK